MDVHVMTAVVGVALALGVGAAATVTGMDRDRALYPATLVMIAGLYVLFGAIDGRPVVIAVEVAGMIPFVAAALFGFRRSLWIVAAALLGHGVYDLLHPHLVDDAGVPPWWPAFCLAYDAAAALYLAWRLGGAGLDARLARRGT